MITLIDRYLLRDVLKALFAILLVLALILLANSFIKLLKEVASGDLNSNLLFQLLGLQMVVYIPRLIPPAFFFAVLYVIGRMYRDSEVVALAACGIGDLRLYRSLIFVVTPIALLTGWLSLYVQPWASRLSAELISMQRGQATELAGISAGRFNEYSRGDLVLYVESIASEKKRMRNVFVQQRRAGVLSLVTARQGYQYVDEESAERYLVLEDGVRYEGSPGEADYRISEFERYGLRIKGAEGVDAKVNRKSLSNEALLSSKSIRDRAEFQVRFAQVLGLSVFALLSLPLSRSMPRQGPFGRLVLAFILYTLYLSLQGVAENWMIDGTTAEWLGIWWVHLMLALIGLSLLIPDSHHYRRMQRKLLRGGA
ncbi:MAG: LPS export ABC transporter permease LptF [Candidatus Thiodiazotropha endolucinida]